MTPTQRNIADMLRKAGRKVTTIDATDERNIKVESTTPETKWTPEQTEFSLTIKAPGEHGKSYRLVRSLGRMLNGAEMFAGVFDVCTSRNSADNYSDDTEKARAEKLAALWNAEKTAALEFCFCARCGEQMNPKHDASALMSSPSPAALRAAEHVAALRKMQSQIIHGKNIFGDIADCIESLAADRAELIEALRNLVAAEDAFVKDTGLTTDDAITDATLKASALLAKYAK